MTDDEYLTAAKSAIHIAAANADRIPGLDGSPEHFMAAAQTDAAVAQALALISIAESLANTSHDARAEAWAKGYAAGSKVEGTER